MTANTVVSEYDELEAASFLRKSTSSENASWKSGLNRVKYFWKPLSFISLLVVVTLFFVSKAQRFTTKVTTIEEDVRSFHTDFFKKPSPTPHSFVKKLKDARSKILAELNSSLYGQYTDVIFNNTRLLNSTIYSKSPSSKERLQRRLKIKFLQSQLGDKTSSFTWVTAGHSAAAGHGNLFSQTYSAVLEETLKDVFRLVNIDFKAKNYAMGGMPSGPEISLCMESLFGTNVDFLSWDFGMTDAGSDFLWEFWIQRAGVHKNRPILMDFNCHDSVNKAMEENGMAIFSFKKNNIYDQIPDTAKQPHIEDLPPAIKYFKCGKAIEEGELCKSHKFDTEKACESAKFQTSWHNGWRDHGTIGRFFAFFIMQNLEEAITDLAERFSVTKNSRSLKKIQLDYVHHLSELQKLEEEDKNTFLSSPELNSVHQVTEFGEKNYKAFQRLKVVCHNSYLPSQARFDGLLSEGKNSKGVYKFAGLYKDYDIGLEVHELMDKTFNDTEIRPLLFAREDSQRQQCETALNIDYKDKFYIHNHFGWTGGVLPTDVENRAFSVGDERKKRKGMIIMCTTICDWGKCLPNYVSISEVNSKIESVMTTNEKNETVFKNVTRAANLTIHVNDEVVVGATPFFRNCFLLSNKNGYIFPKSENSKLEGKFDIKFKVILPEGFLELTSIIIA